tara:strand:- start:4628 stop:5044 length:417 start_codon:yes stop_codon:yes gene_type:complete
MASFDINIPPETNAGSQYFNINQCRSFKITLATNKALTRFTSTGQVNGATAVAGYPCGEVTVINKSGKTIEVYDGGHGLTTDNPPEGNTIDCIFMDDNDTFTFRGLTNTGEISARNTEDNAAVNIYVRAQFFSDNPAR